MKITGNELATPIDDAQNNTIIGGLTIRQHFSIDILKALIVNNKNLLDYERMEIYAHKAITQADLLIKVINIVPNPNE